MTKNAFHSRILLKVIQNAHSQEEIDWLLLQQSLAHLSTDWLEIVAMTAIPHWVDSSFIAKLLPNQASDVILKTVTSLPFIQQDSNRLYFDETKRKTLLNWLWNKNPNRFIEVSLRAVAYCKEQIQQHENWRIEELYHLAIANSELAIVELCSEMEKWFNAPHFAYGKMENILQTIIEHALEGRLKDSVYGWVLLWGSRVDTIYSHLRDAYKKLTTISHLADIEELLLAKTHQGIAEIKRIYSEDNDAIQSYRQALSYYQGLNLNMEMAECHHRIGEVMHFKLDGFKMAREEFYNALSIYEEHNDVRKITDCLASIVDTSIILEDFQTAKNDCLKLIALCKEIDEKQVLANGIYRLGQILFSLGQLNEAQELLVEAEELLKLMGRGLDHAYCLKTMGGVEVALGQCEEAQKHYKDAESFFRQSNGYKTVAMCLRELGRLTEINAQYEDALAYYQRTLSYYRKSNPEWVECTATIANVQYKMLEFDLARQNYELINDQVGVQLCNQAVPLTNEYINIQFDPLSGKSKG